MIRSAVKLFALSCLAAALASAGWSTDPPASDPPGEAPAAVPTVADIVKLKAQVDEQQKQLDKLRAVLDAQLKALEQAAANAPAAPASPVTPEKKPYVGQLTASAVPMVQPAPSANPFPPTSPSPRRPVSLDSPSPQAGEPPRRCNCASANPPSLPSASWI